MGLLATTGLVHDAFVYSTPEEFLSATLPFIREAIAEGEPILAAPTRTNVALLKRELGDDAARVDWAEDAHLHRPVERLRVFTGYIAEQVNQGATRVRLLGEPVWPSDSDAGVAEWKRYESFLNLALAPHPVWLVCPYCASELSESIVADACRTHPYFGYGHDRGASASYVAPLDFARELDLDEAFAPAPPDAVERSFDVVADVRRFVVEEARAAGLTGAKVADIKLAASEVATNVFRHASGAAKVRTWASERELVCEVRDAGPGIRDPFAGYVVPEPTHAGGWGLSIARQVCDVVEVRAAPGGTIVRLHIRL